ncbi:MAG: hypothetical protein JNK04_10330, partial [Myxococcales bacterium]|nr:hypothetical protein [Myxococcales bacterium]
TFVAGDDGWVERPFPVPEDDLVRALADLDGAFADTSLAIATSNALFFCGPLEGELACARQEEFDDGVIIGLTAGDFDADGVSDIAIAREDGMSVHRQLTAQDGVSLGE